MGILLGAAMAVVAMIAFSMAGEGRAADAGGPAARRTIWDLQLGQHARQLSRSDYVDLACGTNGGPPSLLLQRWTDFAKCPVESGSGFHEIYFRYDDELQYINLAQAPDNVVVLGTTEYQLPVIVSALFDDNGFLVGLRLVTDPRTDTDTRELGANLLAALKARFGNQAWTCGDVPSAEGETPYRGAFIKTRCAATDASAGTRLTLESNIYRKAGQATLDPVTGQQTTGQFVSMTRFEKVLMNGIADPAEKLAMISDPPPTDIEILAKHARDCAGCNLQNANLKRADLHGANLAGADLTGADLHAANLAGADLTGAKLGDANLNKADLRQAKLGGAALPGAMLYASRLDGADLHAADLTDVLAGTVQMIRINAAGMIATGADFRGARASDSDFSRADLSESLLRGVQFTRANLSGANLSDSRLWQASLTNANLTGVQAAGAEFIGANLRGADLSSGDFSSADLSGTIFTDVTTTGAKFDNAVLPAAFPH